MHFTQTSTTLDQHLNFYTVDQRLSIAIVEMPEELFTSFVRHVGSVSVISNHTFNAIINTVAQL